MAEGQNAERQWRRDDARKEIIAKMLVAEGQNAERQWRHDSVRSVFRYVAGGRRAERRKAMET